MQAHATGARFQTHERRRLRWSEPKQIHEHEGLAVEPIERRERPLEVQALVVVLIRGCWIDPVESAAPFEEAFPTFFEEYPSSDPE